MFGLNGNAGEVTRILYDEKDPFTNSRRRVFLQNFSEFLSSYFSLLFRSWCSMSQAMEGDETFTALRDYKNETKSGEKNSRLEKEKKSRGD